jgi:hypothetical protein
MATEKIARELRYLAPRIPKNFQVLKERGRTAKPKDCLEWFVRDNKNPYRPHPSEMRDDQFQCRVDGGTETCFDGQNVNRR